jgi:hypothetical protein
MTLIVGLDQHWQPAPTDGDLISKGGPEDLALLIGSRPLLSAGDSFLVLNFPVLYLGKTDDGGVGVAVLGEAPGAA